MSQVALFAVATPPPPESIDLRCCDVVELLGAARDARLIVADPPWSYTNGPGVANPAEHGIYGCVTDSAIVYHLDLAYQSAGKNCRLAVWYTWPKDAEWAAAGRAGKRWGPAQLYSLLMLAEVCDRLDHRHVSDGAVVSLAYRCHLADRAGLTHENELRQLRGGLLDGGLLIEVEPNRYTLGDQKARAMRAHTRPQPRR